MNPTNIPPQPPKSFRVTLQILNSRTRLDGVLLAALRAQGENLNLKNISRLQFKKLFNDKKVLIKGQPARPSSELASGTTWVDILL